MKISTSTSKKVALLTGGSGFLGGELTRHLLEDEYDEPELTEDEIQEALENLAADVADQGGRWTATQRQQYNELKQ